MTNQQDKIQKTLYIISGCNGAGKTTASVTVLPDILDCREFVNADEIAKGLSPFKPEDMAIKAGRLMLQRIETLIKGDESFAIETTLSTLSYSKTIKEAQKNGFNVHLLFFWLPTPRHALLRVSQRVQEGGHDIPTEVILRRYKSGLNNLFNIYIHIVDSWMLIENNSNPRILVADCGKYGINIYNKVLYDKMKAYVK